MYHFQRLESARIDSTDQAWKSIEEFLVSDNPKEKHHMSFKRSYILRDEAYVRGTNPSKSLANL